jgi:tetratricopeptide (TPR) repeat protein
MRRLFSRKGTLTTTALLLACAGLRAQTLEDLIQEGDLRDKKFQASEALTFYLPAEKAQPKNVPLLLKIARQYRHMMTDVAGREEKLKLGGQALGYGMRAVVLAPDDAEAQLSVAISHGKMLPYQGKREQVEASRRIKSAAEMAVRLDPGNDLAWHVLGKWHQAVADVSGVKRALGQRLYGSLPSTTNEEAVRCFNQAMKLNPHRLRHYIELGRTYARMGRKAEARQFLTKGLAMPDAEKDDPEIKRLGREALAKLR